MFHVSNVVNGSVNLIYFFSVCYYIPFMKKLHRHRFPTDIIFLCVRWYLRYNLSYRDLQEMMMERGVKVSHQSIFKWVLKFVNSIDVLRKKSQNYYTLSWRIDETYIKIKGKMYYYYRAIDSHGNLIDFYLSPKRDKTAAEMILRKSIRTAGIHPEKIVTDKDLAYPVSIPYVCPHAKHLTNKYLNNIIECDHRCIKKRLRTMKHLKSPDTGGEILKGIEGVCELYKIGVKGEDFDFHLASLLQVARGV
jgi:transposase, IS6 family